MVQDQELVGGPMPAETSLRMTSTACLAENENIWRDVAH